jgi:hypothetical protein
MSDAIPLSRRSPGSVERSASGRQPRLAKLVRKLPAVAVGEHWTGECQRNQFVLG